MLLPIMIPWALVLAAFYWLVGAQYLLVFAAAVAALHLAVLLASTVQRMVAKGLPRAYAHR